ncbi:MAG: hypothetical protein CMJ46_15320 [Planctomyces sp.]|nr:hypothetical protein [Planctomyces sp.]
MNSPLTKLDAQAVREYRRNGPDCGLVNQQIQTISDYFRVIDSALTDNREFWFRGHSNSDYKLIPSALRFDSSQEKQAADNLLPHFKRLAQLKIRKPPATDDHLSWSQHAQHYGLYSRLLDWTQNAALALFFACGRQDTNGAVYILNPIDLNLLIDPKRPRIFNTDSDRDIIDVVLNVDGKRRKYSKEAIAIHPVWDSERILLQRGVFTLHGPNNTGLDRNTASSLLCIPVLAKFKDKLLSELDRIGICESSVFPELEHLCSYLKSRRNSFH